MLIQIEYRPGHGPRKAYPVNALAHCLAELTGKVTLSPSVVSKLKAQGFIIEESRPLAPSQVTPPVRYSQPRTGVQRQLLQDVVAELNGAIKPFEALTRTLAARLPLGDGRDQRVARMQRAIGALIEAGFVRRDGDLVSIPSTDDFLGEAT